MTALACVAGVATLLAVLPAALFFLNLRLYRVPPIPNAIPPSRPAVSLLIPARNEEAGIGACVEAALKSTGVELEVIVLDDHSDDNTRTVVTDFGYADPRARVESAPELPANWCGKQHACHVLAKLARHPLIAFIDADVRLSPDGLARAIAFQQTSNAALVSGVPRQETGTLMERLLIPLIHFLLLSYLPLSRMRSSTRPAYGAGCGQFFLTTKDAYARAGGHAAIRHSLHDGIQLPRTYRQEGLMTDLFDATPVATCRMYRTDKQVWSGLSKNATEGLASAKAIVPWTLLLIGGQVLPVAILISFALSGMQSAAAKGIMLATAVGACASYAVRFVAARRFQQSFVGVLLHPVGIVVLILIQWAALGRRLAGNPTSWRGRSYGASLQAGPR